MVKVNIGTARWQTTKEFQKNFKCNKLSLNGKKHYKTEKGGLVVGYKKNRKTEEIYYVEDDIHSLTIGATRSGKTRSVVLQTIGNLALAGESMILSDPKGELFEYTAPYLKSKGYKVITLDFKNPMKSNRYKLREKSSTAWDSSFNIFINFKMMLPYFIN